MKHDPSKQDRRSIRLKGYDYSQVGAYFVTMVAHHRECVFGEVAEGEVNLSPIGQIAHDYWSNIPTHFTNVELDEFIIMPNHVHGIIVIADDERGRGGVPPPNPNDRSSQMKKGEATSTQEGEATSPLREPAVRRATLGQIVAYYKYETTKRINALRDTQGAPVWQRNYFEHIVRDDSDLERIRTYIFNNPFNWQSDEENPKKVGQR